MTRLTKTFGTLASVAVAGGAMFLGTPKAQAADFVVVTRPVLTARVVVAPVPVYATAVYVPTVTYVPAPAPVYVASSVVMTAPAYCPAPVVVDRWHRGGWERHDDWGHRDRDRHEGYGSGWNRR